MSNEVMIGVLGVLNGREVSEPTTVSPEPADDYQEKKSFMSHAVLGIIIGVVIGLIIVFAILLILGHKSKNSAKTKRDVKVTETPVNEPEAPDMISGDEEDTEQEEIDSSIEDASEDITEDISEDTEESNNSTGIIGESVDSEEDSTETDGVGNVIGE
jgi:flagellar biosynthesis/type III secretory pathway M-ring protein FliF/YscJ